MTAQIPEHAGWGSKPTLEDVLAQLQLINERLVQITNLLLAQRYGLFIPAVDPNNVPVYPPVAPSFPGYWCPHCNCWNCGKTHVTCEGGNNVGPTLPTVSLTV